MLTGSAVLVTRGGSAAVCGTPTMEVERMSVGRFLSAAEEWERRWSCWACARAALYWSQHP
jgi:hypothetical protein